MPYLRNEDYGYPSLPPVTDEIDLKARKLRAFLFDEEEGIPASPGAHREHNITASTLGSGPSSALHVENEPIHPVLVACRAWKVAIRKHDAYQAQLSAARLQTLLRGMHTRPTIAQAFSHLHFDQPESSENEASLDAIAQFIAQSNA